MSLTLSPLDGRYQDKLGMKELRSFCSEYALNKYRLRVEVEWLKLLADCQLIKELEPFNIFQIQDLNQLILDFDLDEANKLKDIEKTIKHDVKAVEYYLREKLKNKILSDNLHTSDHQGIWYGHNLTVLEFIHFGCTSEDINNLAYALMLRDCRNISIGFDVRNITESLRKMAKKYAQVSMVSRTHGQFASGTTLGKELMVFVKRLEGALVDFFKVQIKGKINGAVGNYNAHLVAYPDVCWLDLSKQMIQERLNLGPDSLLEITTQIESHDYLATYFHALIRINTILIDLSRDIWGYISLGYFQLHIGSVEEVGSSTMPHKVNPIDFENAEGNLGLANALLEHMARKLPISRWQRDLTDSTVMRNIGVGIGHGVVAYQSILQGLKKLIVSHQAINRDLDQAWVLLAEPIQTMMRKYGLVGGYERMKQVFRGGQEVKREQVWELIDNLEELPSEIKKNLKMLTPANYIGMADSF